MTSPSAQPFDFSSLPAWIGLMTPTRTWFFLASAVAAPAVACLIAGWFILDSRIGDVHRRIDDARDAVSKEITDKTDGGKIQAAVATLSAELKGLADLPGKVDVLTQAINGARLDIVKGLENVRTEVSAVRERTGVIETKLDGFRSVLDETKGDVKTIIQRTASLGRPEAPANAAIDYVLAAAPESQKKTWETLLFKVRDSLSKAQLTPVFYQRHFLVRADDSAFSLLTKVGFEKFDTSAAQVGEWPLPAGLYVKAPGFN